MDASEVEGNVAFIVWHSSNDGATVPLGTDTFVAVTQDRRADVRRQDRDDLARQGWLLIHHPLTPRLRPRHGAVPRESRGLVLR